VTSKRDVEVKTRDQELRVPRHTSKKKSMIGEGSGGCDAIREQAQLCRWGEGSRLLPIFVYRARSKGKQGKKRRKK